MLTKSANPAILLAVTSLVLIIAGPGCNTTPTRTPESAYTLNGAIVIDPNLEGTMISNSVRVAVQFRQDGQAVSSTSLFYDGNPLTFHSRLFDLDSVFAMANDLTTSNVGITGILTLSDSALSDTVSIAVPDTFTISNVVPGNHLIEGLEQVSLEWTANAGAESFVLAAVHADSLYSGRGFSKYVDAQATSGTIPPEAFSNSTGTGPNVGLYYLYVYAVSDSPDSSVAGALLPTHLPQDHPDNIAGSNLTGKYGSVVVTAFDTIRVVDQP